MQLPESKLTRNQRTTRRTEFRENGRRYELIAEIRYDDQCGNGHNTFAITGSIYDMDAPSRKRGKYYEKGEPTVYGCIHDEIGKHLPELREAIPFHLVSSDGPMHYPGNVLHFARDRDCWGRRKGEPATFESSIVFDGNPIRHAPGRHNSDKFIKWIGERKEADSIKYLKVEAIRHRKADDPNSYNFGPNYTFGGFGE